MKLINQVMVKLQELKLSPEKYDKGILFTFENEKYFCCNYEQEGCVCFLTYILDVKEYELLDVLKAINSVNKNMHFGRLYVTQDNIVCASYENWVLEAVKLECVIENALTIFSFARNQFIKLLKRS